MHDSNTRFSTTKIIIRLLKPHINFRGKVEYVFCENFSEIKQFYCLLNKLCSFQTSELLFVFLYVEQSSAIAYTVSIVQFLRTMI